MSPMPNLLPLFPAAATSSTPALYAAFIASSAANGALLAPRLILTTCIPLSTDHSTPLMTLLQEPLPLESRTLTAERRARGATPYNTDAVVKRGNGPCHVRPVAVVIVARGGTKDKADMAGHRQVRMVKVDHGDPDSLTLVVPVYQISADMLHAPWELLYHCLDGRVLFDGKDSRALQ